MKSEQGNKSITGIMETEKGKIVFFAEKFKFTFLNADFSGESVILNADESGYVWGKTYDGNVIAIYSHNDIEVKSNVVLNTWNYIISRYQYMPKQSMQSFKGIRFTNGAIKTIYPCNGLVYDPEESKGDMIVYHRKKDCKEYKLMHGDKLVDWTFSSMINQRKDIGEGDSLSNSSSLLDITFDEEQPLSVFYDYYGYVCDLCSFLTFRRNISFEKVYLFHELITDTKEFSVHEPYAECYIRTPDIVSQRKLVNIIHVHYIDDEVFNNIFNNIIKKNKKHKGLPVSIAPKDDSDVYMMDAEKIKNICSALEMELDLEGVRIPVNEELQDLIESVKEMVKEHQERNKLLSEKEYEYIFSNMSHWGQPLSERAWEAWGQHENEMIPFLEKYGISVTQDNVQAFVKARNNITHNGFNGKRQILRLAF